MTSEPFFKYPSRRSTVYSTKGLISSTQPLATSAGLTILNKGGNAVDAAIAVAAALGVTETASTDLGGDAFMIYYEAKTGKVHGLNGCGRSSFKVSLELIEKMKPEDIKDNRLSPESIFSVNVPGGPACWDTALSTFGSGKISWAEVLQPAIELAENGYPISQISAELYRNSQGLIRRANEFHGDEFLNQQVKWFLPNEGLTPPKEGQIMKNPYLASTLKLMQEQGVDAFYEGDIAKDIVKEVQARGGVLDETDLKLHSSTIVFPINYEFLGKKLWEIPPNGSGIVALLALGLIKALDAKKVIDLSKLEHNSAEYLHLIIEVLKLAFKDSEEYVHDPEHALKDFGVSTHDTIAKLLHPDSTYFQTRCQKFNPEKSLQNSDLHSSESHSSGPTSLPDKTFQSDTAYFSVTDSEGNAVSFITSVYHNFGSGIIVPNRGFFLQNRGANFSLLPESKNFIKGGKRPYHTIIPGLITESKGQEQQDSAREQIYATYGIQGGFNQPQAHVQVYLNLLLFGMTPQQSLDAPRISLTPDPRSNHTDAGHGTNGPVSNAVTVVNIEEGIPQEVVDKLKALGHEVRYTTGLARRVFGRGQVIRKESKVGEQLVWGAGSDMRGDGAAVAQW
ncbi:hypothetical protein WICPIJ_008613 [Wickerhamomyces pijperi]|uniref:Gamma-glutamyltransferase n=1 Tax=Wickerhamomyces pijperi TaxID=599730 RepID=A0A9P8PXP6_WICPI|nr:hypothetical protein WICPIJ_008613 [Wickerhamomyces pijperi]